MHQHYGIDLGEPGILERRPERWLQSRIAGLLITDTRLRAAIYPPPES